MLLSNRQRTAVPVPLVPVPTDVPDPLMFLKGLARSLFTTRAGLARTIFMRAEADPLPIPLPPFCGVWEQVLVDSTLDPVSRDVAFPVGRPLAERKEGAAAGLERLRCGSKEAKTFARVEFLSPFAVTKFVTGGAVCRRLGIGRSGGDFSGGAGGGGRFVNPRLFPPPLFPVVPQDFALVGDCLEGGLLLCGKEGKGEGEERPPPPRADRTPSCSAFSTAASTADNTACNRDRLEPSPDEVGSDMIL